MPIVKIIEKINKAILTGFFEWLINSTTVFAVWAI